MPQGPSVTVDGKGFDLHYFTGKVISTRKDKETVVSSRTLGTQNNPQVQISSTTHDHHEFFLQDETGKEQSFKTVDLDFPCREGQTVSVIWAIPKGTDFGPYIHVRNHNTEEYRQIGNVDIASHFKKPWWMVWGSGVGLSIVLIPILGPVSMFGLLPPFFYFRWRSRKSAKQFLASSELMGLDRQLAEVRPLAA